MTHVTQHIQHAQHTRDTEAVRKQLRELATHRVPDAQSSAQWQTIQSRLDHPRIGRGPLLIAALLVVFVLPLGWWGYGPQHNPIVSQYSLASTERLKWLQDRSAQTEALWREQRSLSTTEMADSPIRAVLAYRLREIDVQLTDLQLVGQHDELSARQPQAQVVELWGRRVDLLESFVHWNTAGRHAVGITQPNAGLLESLPHQSVQATTDIEAATRTTTNTTYREL